MRADHDLSVEEARHTAQVHRLLVDEIDASGGWMSFERYMELALYAPGLGYYSAGARKFGRDGDFVTAPEVSSLFGACVAQQCADVLRELDGGTILEIGAGTGRLAVDVLQRLATLDCLPDRYYIVDVSADLRDRQRALVESQVPRIAERVIWLDAPPEAPFDGVILANEVLDSLPVVRFRWRDDDCQELGVGMVGERFAWIGRTASAALTTACRALDAAAGGWDDGYVSEYVPRLSAWACAVTRPLRNGAVLWFDYGLPRPQLYLPERHEGTLRCHFRHRAHDDPFACPGLQDITAWVDFTAVAEAGLRAGFTVDGFTTQAFLLAGLGIETAMARLAGGDEHRFARLANEARRLVLPGEMGEIFKAMAWTRGLAAPLAGFALQDMRHTL